MRSVDTNIILRAMVPDAGSQTVAAEAVLLTPTLLLATVVLEAVWVLRKAYGWSPRQLAIGFDALFATPLLYCPDESAVRWALDRAIEGADFADMLHLALSGRANCFTTFDRDVARHADTSVVPVETLA